MLFTINLCKSPRKIIYECTFLREMFFPVYRNPIPNIEFRPWDLIQRTGKADFPCSHKQEYHQAWYNRVILLGETTKKWFPTKTGIQTRHYSILDGYENIKSMPSESVPAHRPVDQGRLASLAQWILGWCIKWDKRHGFGCWFQLLNLLLTRQKTSPFGFCKLTSPWTKQFCQLTLDTTYIIAYLFWSSDSEFWTWM